MSEPQLLFLLQATTKRQPKPEGKQLDSLSPKFESVKDSCKSCTSSAMEATCALFQSRSYGYLKLG